MESNMQAVAGEKLQWDVKRQPAGKILSLDRQEAKKVLEIYVSRSLSCRESALTAKKGLQEGARRRGRKADELQRSKSDFCKYQPCAKLSPEEDREERPKAPDADKASDDESKTPKEVPKEKLEAKKKSTKSSSQGKTQRSWFKTFINFLFKKSPEEQKETVGQKAKEKDAKAPHSSKPEGAKRPGVDSSTSPPLGRAPKRRPSLKKVFSFKKHAEEERGEAAAGARAKRPSCLPLRHVQTPATPDVEQPDGYYARVSEEIGLLVQGRESPGSRADPHRAAPRPASTDSIDEAIKRIVALLQSAGDELDRQLREDARLQLFFKDLSYSSFKDLADAYVHREMRASRPDADLQEVQFAFTVHLTAKVAGICNQAVNRIMGFGTRYLEDSLPPYSHILQRSRDQSRTDNFESPD